MKEVCPCSQQGHYLSEKRKEGDIETNTHMGNSGKLNLGAGRCAME